MIPNHPRHRRAHTEGIERVFENRRIRFLDTYFFGDCDTVEQVVEIEARQLVPLFDGSTIRHKTGFEPARAARPKHRYRVGHKVMGTSAFCREGIGDFKRKGDIVDAQLHKSTGDIGPPNSLQIVTIRGGYPRLGPEPRGGGGNRRGDSRRF